MARHIHPVLTLALGALLMVGVAGVTRCAEAPVPELDDANSWAFTPAEDKLSPDALLDLRYLNERAAGETGYVRLSEDGNGFVLGSGAPVRFWGVHASSRLAWSDADAARNARWLAKLGVNLVRTGGGLKPNDENSKITDVNAKAVQEIQRTIAVMKKEGIYSMVCPFWGGGGASGSWPASWGIEGYSGKVNVEGLLWFEPTLQEGYKSWIRHLLTDPNPYTGIPLKDESAMAFFEIANEDNMLFYWVDSIKGGPRQLLEQKFAQWATAKYGSTDKALAAWGGGAVKGDAPQEGRLGLMIIWYATWDGKQKDPNPKRMRDQLQFYAETERAFGLEMKRYISQDLGCKALMDTSDFRPADQALMGDLALWCKSAGDLICLNSYYALTHKSPANAGGWRIDPGDFFQDHSATTQPLTITALKKQFVGRPYFLTETLWVPPTAYEAEAPLLLASYMDLSGLDCAMFAGPRAVTWDPDPYLNFLTIKGDHPMQKWNCADPGTMANFPAAALIHRLSYVKQSEPVVHEERTMDQMLDLKPPMVADAADFDPNQYAQFYRANPQMPGGVPPQAFLVGRVEVVVNGDPAKSHAVDMGPYIKGTAVRSITGELTMDSDPGLFTVDAPKAQGVAGFLKAAGGRFALADVTIESGNGYAVVVVVPLDGRPLAESGKVLVQVGTICRPTGWKVEPGTYDDKGNELQGYKIISTGRMPWRVTKADVTVTVGNPNLSRAVRLDAGGYAAGDLPVQASAGKLTVKFPSDTSYIVLQ